MANNGNFWDNAQTEAEPTTVPEKVPSTEPSESIETTMPISEIQPQGLLQDASDGFIPHEPREIEGSIIAQTLIAVFVGAVLFGAIGFGIVGEIFEVFPMDCDSDLIEIEDGTYLCNDGLYRYNAGYEFFDNSTVSATNSDDFGYVETVRWEHSDNFSVLGFIELDWDNWYAWEYCEWEGESFAGDTRWYCSYSEDYYEEAFHYCEYSESLWFCTDQYRIAESNRNPSDEKSYINDLIYSCYKTIPLSELSNQSLSELEDKFFQQSYPSWCDGRAVLSSEVNSNDTQLPFDGEAFLTFYEDWNFEIYYANIMQYSSEGVASSSLSIGSYDSNGEKIVDAALQKAGLVIIVTIGILYILGVYATYTKKTYIAHLGSENTVVLKSSWFNKPAKEKGRIPLTPASYLREYISYSTDSDGNSTSSTNYSICTPGQPSLSVPSRFSRQKLVEVTGLPVREDFDTHDY
jgi:hypothetical protein